MTSNLRHMLIGNLPDEWRLEKIRNLGGDKRPSVKAGPFGSSLKKEFFVERGYKIYGQEQVISGDPFYGNYFIDENKFKSLKSCEVLPGDILISLVGTVGKVLVIPTNAKPGIINPRLLRLSFDKKRVNTDFAKYYLSSSQIQKLLLRYSQGGTMGVLNAGIISEMPFPLPPLPEQRKIADILSTWDEAIACIERLIATLQQRKKGFMQRLLTGEVRFPGVEKSKEKRETKYGIIPLDWNIKTVLELGKNSKNTVQTGPFGAQLHASDYVAEGVPLILIRNIGDNRLNTDDIPKISPEDADRLKRYAIRENDIVFSRVGRVGSCFLATKEHGGWIISGQTLRIRLPRGVVNFEYLSYVLQDDKAQRYITGTSIGSTRQSISTKVLESLPLVLPSIPEQEKIASVLKDCDREIELHTQKLEALKQQKKGLMQRLLTGEVRVKVE